MDYQPFQLVENKGFRKYTHTLNPDYVIPTRKKIVEMLEEKYVICTQEVKKQLQHIEYIAITSDIWTSDSNKSFISVNAHFIDINV